ncbi:histidinol dehydrogenase [Pacificimonas flava]|uniref:Histidinol dehydrogenase n=2 Tax=Pacificimonas TaxID=1960290 RepID=A0A219B3A2_9SPHN|nr:MULTISPECIES: histidinol dehydrogenase [Pacificimonas]MBZ6377664.1 histidinol dehydrogenase [Pacificimonas aurantium]OWV32654.1 histidinol dehydrogenase [Pacificimonas flava]
MQRLDAGSADFGAKFAALVADRREASDDVSAVVADIVRQVAARGDEALADYCRRFDAFDPAEGGLRVPSADIENAKAHIDPAVADAMALAAARIRAFHEAQMPADHSETEDSGTVRGWRYTAVERAGIYVPGGRAPLFSSVLMNAIPAKVAGVEHLVMTTPAPGGRIDPHILAAVDLAGIDEVYRVGGAQAVGALAFGTETIPSVDMIAGPGNAYVAEAKRQMFGRVGIDMVAGPSEILIVADEGADPEVLAADLLSQAEHDPTSQSILITDSANLADAVDAALPAAFAAISTEAAARESWDANGAIITVSALMDAAPLIDALAPEHLALAMADPAPLFDAVRHAGSVFLGYQTPEAIGDYLAGPNHVLPTGRRARFSSGLGTASFMKRTTFLNVSAAGMAELGPAAAALAHAEQLPAHALSIERRLARR